VGSVYINKVYCSLRRRPGFGLNLGPLHTQHEPLSSSNDNDASVSLEERIIKLSSEWRRVTSGLSAGCYGCRKIAANISARCTDSKRLFYKTLFLFRRNSFRALLLLASCRLGSLFLEPEDGGSFCETSVKFYLTIHVTFRPSYSLPR
jgi:hypothetical protein